MGINEKTGTVFSVAAENAPLAGCTVSKAVADASGAYVSHFSLAAGTDISPETYQRHKLWFVADGELEALILHRAKSVKSATFIPDEKLGELCELGARQSEDGCAESPILQTGDLFVTPIGVPVGVRSERGGVYTEIEIGKDTTMNKMLETGKAFALKDVLPYAEGRIVNMDLASGPNMKFVLMSFDAGTGLSEHAAPGDALVFALDGEATIGYDGAEHVVKAGENFKFAKNGRHWVKANGRFKMALLLVVD